MDKVQKDLEFHKERCLYYKRLRDATNNPALYVDFEKEMRYHLYKTGYLLQQMSAFERLHKS